jgi:hypothetical protein
MQSIRQSASTLADGRIATASIGVSQSYRWAVLDHHDTSYEVCITIRALEAG